MARGRKAFEDSDLHKGVVESDRYNNSSQVSMTGQLAHRTSESLLKQFDSDFPEPGGNAEHTGEPEGLPAGEHRHDEVGRSGVYPMSGPHPPGKAPIRGQMEWGQGERGAAGYYDHGGSELTYEGGQVLGGLTSGPGGEPGPDPLDELSRPETVPENNHEKHS